MGTSLAPKPNGRASIWCGNRAPITFSKLQWNKAEQQRFDDDKIRQCAWRSSLLRWFYG